MHSKVIIASLACVLAASLVNSRTTNISVNAQQPKVEEARCCKAPNEDGINAVLYADKPYQSNDFCLFLQGLEYQSAMASHMDILGRSSGLTVYPLAYNPAYGYYYNVAQPASDGDYYVTYGAYGKEVATIYIYRSNGICYGSTLSKFDARAKYFKNEVATSSELSYYPQNWGNSYSVNSTTAVNALKHYGTYIYSGTSDITMGLTTTQRSGWNDFGSNLSIKVHVEMYKNGTFYPVESARVRLLSSGTELGSATKRTNSSGNYTYSMSFMDTFNKTLGNIQVGISTDTAQAIIRDNNGLDYPYFYTTSSSTNLFTLKTIQYNIKIYPERSDRAAAYEVSQAELVPYKYTNYYSGSSISAAKVLFPAEKTSYYTSFDNYLGVSANNLIAIKKAHSNVWDVMNHEYGHYISDMLNLSMDPSNDIYWTHTYNEDLIHTYDFEQGRRIAYSEGLATYLGVAAQLDYATRVSSNSYCATIADEKYIDPVNDVTADFGQYRYGVQNGFYGQGVESSIPSAMIKFLDNVTRTSDNVALGHQKMWNAIRAAGSNTCDILTFDDVLVSQNPTYISGIYSILDMEYIPHPDLPPQNEAEWTIMFYMCGSTLESGGGNNCSGNITRAISNILEAENKPADVNVIIETGGCTDWQRYNIPNNMITRYYVDNGQLNLDTTGVSYDRYASMGSEAAFESFLDWGLTYYPAEKTGIILMNHGGALDGVCFDTAHNNDSLTNSEARQAFRNVLGTNPTEKLEFIQYDACLMALQDVAKTNAEFFKYMVASENEISEIMVSGTSAQWLEGLYAGQDTLVFLETMINDFIRNGCGWEQTSTILDLSQMNAYYNAFELLATKINETIRNSQDADALYSLLEGSSFPYCPCSNSNDFMVKDCYSFLNRLKNEWYCANSLTTYIDDVLDFFPDEDEYEVDWDADYRRVEARGDSLVRYHVASLGYSGSVPVTHGLSVHYGYYDFDAGAYYPTAESDFVTWRYLVLY